MAIAEFFNENWYFEPLLWLICAVIWMARGRLCLGSIIGGLGFLLLVMNGIIFGIWRGFDGSGAFESPDLYNLVLEVLPYTSLIYVLGQVLVLTGLATTRYRRSGDAATSRAYDDRPREADVEWAEPVDDGWDEDRGGYGYQEYGSGEMGPPAPLSEPGWGLAVGWIALSALGFVFGIVALALVLDAGSHISDDEMVGIVIAYVLCFLTLVPAVILFYVWLYRAWSAVPPRYRSTSPGKAVGFMFIPFYNLYWVFRAIPGLSASINRAQLDIEPDYARGTGYGLGILACIVAVIPYVNLLSWPLFVIWIIVANSARNRLLRSRRIMERAGA